jgi:hypothetical protein
MTIDDCAGQQLDAVIMGGGLAGLTLALQLKPALSRPRRAGAGAPCAPGAARGAQGGRVVGGDRRALLRHCARPEGAHGRRSCASSAFASSSAKAAATSTTSPRSARAATCRCPATRSTAASSRTSWPRRPRAAACASSTARWCGASTLPTTPQAPAPHRAGRAAGRPTSRQARWLDRRLRARRHAQAQAGPGRAERARRQRGVVPHRRAHRHRRLERQRRMARALHPAGALALDQPPGGRGLLGLADSAGLGLALGGHRGRPALHPLDTIDTFEKAMAGSPPTSRACTRRSTASATCCRTSRSSSTSRTAASRCSRASAGRMTGEAGLFLDPFYSPGSDFIAIGNTYITDLIGAGPRGPPVEARAQLYDQIYHSFYESTLALYQDQYPLFGDPEVLPVKVIWDYAYYWGVLSQIFFQQRLTDLRAGQPEGRAAALPAAERRGAGAAARLVGLEREAQPGRDARPGRDAVVRRAQPQPDRHAGRRRLQRAHPRLGGVAAPAGPARSSRGRVPPTTGRGRRRPAWRMQLSEISTLPGHRGTG